MVRMPAKSLWVVIFAGDEFLALALNKELSWVKGVCEVDEVRGI
jgi:hypothetical protein